MIGRAAHCHRQASPDDRQAACDRHGSVDDPSYRYAVSQCCRTRAEERFGWVTVPPVSPTSNCVEQTTDDAVCTVALDAGNLGRIPRRPGTLA